MTDDFFNEDEEFRDLISKCETAFEDGTLESLKFSEEEFEYLINYFIDEIDDQIVYTLTEMAYNQHPYSSELILRYADVLIVNNQPGTALEILQKQHAQDPGNSDIYFLLGRVYIKWGDEEMADKYIQNALTLTSEEKSDMVLTASQDYIDSYNYKKAIELLEWALKISPSNMEIINDLAFCYEREEQLEKSLVFYEKYLDLDPFNDNVWFNVGTIHARNLNFNKALEAFDYAIALNTYNSSVWYNKAILLINSGKYDLGIEAFKQFLELEPDNVYALVGIADAYLGKERLDEALKFFELAVKISPDHPDANTGAAYVLLLQGKYATALEHLRKICTMEGADYTLLAGELLITYKKTKDPEYLVHYLIALYNTNEPELFLLYLEILLAYGQVWMARLTELIPAIKKDIDMTGRIDKLKKSQTKR